jgi:MarR family 2-MHQ and catechol resistance regulon transcriptional repressor
MKDQEINGLLLDWAAIIARLSMHDLNRSMRSKGLSLAQMVVMLHLKYKGPSEVMQLGELTRLSPAGASQLVERLVQMGLARRTETAGDRRVRMVHLTEQGNTLVDESMQTRQLWVDDLCDKLDNEEKTSIAGALRLLNEKFGEVGPPAGLGRG